VVVKAAGALSGWFVRAMGVSGRAGASFVGALTPTVVMTVAVGGSAEASAVSRSGAGSACRRSDAVASCSDQDQVAREAQDAGCRAQRYGRSLRADADRAACSCGRRGIARRARFGELCQWVLASHSAGPSPQFVRIARGPYLLANAA
jgi:hypothetical protein